MQARLDEVIELVLLFDLNAPENIIYYISYFIIIYYIILHIIISLTPKTFQFIPLRTFYLCIHIILEYLMRE